MNYLAHLYFSDPEPMAWAGSLMGDFLKGPVPIHGDRQLLRHLRLHRLVDRFAHENKHFRASCARLDHRYRFGRGILVDVFYDHFLARFWDEFAGQPLEEFSGQVYAGLRSCHDLLPEGMQNLLPRMERDNWLLSYRHESVVDKVLSSLERRLRHRLPLADGLSDLRLHVDALEDDFRAFLLDADVFVTRWKQSN